MTCWDAAPPFPQTFPAVFGADSLAEVGISAHLDARDPAWLQRLERVNSKRFGMSKAQDFAERARQMRFLQARGFTTEQIRAVLERK